MSEYLLAIDAGTTSIRAMLFDRNGLPKASAQQAFAQHFPAPGWVEQDGDEIWETTLAVAREALAKAQIEARRIAAIGLANQRETTLLWDRASGRLLHRAIVWQDRRTAAICERLRMAGHEPRIADKTGLLLDPYFSATKIAWLLDQLPDARAAAERGELCFGTIDTWLLWKLSGGRTFATDASNASRTLLFNLREQRWDAELCNLFGIPMALLPEVRDSNANFGTLDAAWLGMELPVRGVLGDQQAALVGQACFTPGMIKCTYGTGGFLVMHTGTTCLQSQSRLLSTVAYRIDGVPSFAIEGSFFIAGAAIQWLRDGLKLLEHAADSERIAASAKGNLGVYLVPAFTGLGAPYWEPHARGALFGLTRDTDAAEIVAAALQSVCFQTRDLLEAMRSDGALPAATLRIDGGMAANAWFAQTLADLLGVAVDRPQIIETTALGAAYMAGLGIGWYRSLDEIATRWRHERHFVTKMDEDERASRYRGWNEAVHRLIR